MSTWKKIRYRLEWLGVCWLQFSIPLLPRRGAHRLGRALGSLAYLADRRGRATATENLALVFGHEKDERDLRRLVGESYRSFARTVVDQFWSRRLDSENHARYVEFEFENPTEFESARETGAIWVTPHYGNFEWIALAMGFRGYPFTIVAQDFKNPLLTDIYRRNREVSGQEVIPQRGSVRRLIRALRNGGHAAFLNDLTIGPSKSATIIECFGRKTCVTAVHAELMKRSGLPVIPGICLPRADGTYRVHVFEALHFGPNDTEQSIAQACWDVFEPVIRDDPAPWLWMYKHWRYLPEGEEETYPSYASRNGRFEEVRRRAGV